LEALIEPYYPKAGNGRQPVGLSIMLRVYFLQQWFNLSDPGAEDALYESPVLRRFAGVDLCRAAADDETTILRFRHLLEEHELCGKILDTVNYYLASKGLRIATGAIVDATIIAAPSSTKNRTKARVRSKVEWCFRILKRVFGFTKVRYRGLKKNHEWLLVAFALVNIYQHRKRLVPLGA
jgi:IS5 family transposase